MDKELEKILNNEDEAYYGFKLVYSCMYYGDLPSSDFIDHALSIMRIDLDARSIKNALEEAREKLRKIENDSNCIDYSEDKIKRDHYRFHPFPICPTFSKPKIPSIEFSIITYPKESLEAHISKLRKIKGEGGIKEIGFSSIEKRGASFEVEVTCFLTK